MILINNSHVLSICKSLKHFQDIKDQIIMATEEKKVAGIGSFDKLKTNTMVKHSKQNQQNPHAVQMF